MVVGVKEGQLLGVAARDHDGRVHKLVRLGDVEVARPVDRV